MNKIAVIIVTYNDYKHACECLESFQHTNLNGLQIKIIVVDNASTAFDPHLLKRRYPKINLITNPRNLGFGQANNLGIRQAMPSRPDFILLINPDTKVDLDRLWLQKLTAVMRQDQNIGIAGPVIEHQISDKTYLDLGGVLNLRLAKARHINKLKVTSEKLKVTSEKLKVRVIMRDFVSAAAMLVRRQALENAGLFDPGYFLYLEDVDFCLKIREYGYKIVNVYSSRIFHYGGTAGNNTLKIWHSWLSSLRFTRKWTPPFWRPVSYLYNLLFYPYLWISWSLKRVKRRLLRLR